MGTTMWREWVGLQLNALVAIVSLAVIAVVGMFTGHGDNVTIPCVTGIAGIAGTLTKGPTPSTTTTTTSNGTTTTSGGTNG